MLATASTDLPCLPTDIRAIRATHRYPCSNALEPVTTTSAAASTSASPSPSSPSSSKSLCFLLLCLCLWRVINQECVKRQGVGQYVVSNCVAPNRKCVHWHWIFSFHCHLYRLQMCVHSHINPRHCALYHRPVLELDRNLCEEANRATKIEQTGWTGEYQISGILFSFGKKGGTRSKKKRGKESKEIVHNRQEKERAQDRPRRRVRVYVCSLGLCCLHARRHGDMTRNTQITEILIV